MNVLGVDVGGANLKVADGRGYACSRVFPLWQRPSELEDVLRRVFSEAPEADHVAASMTGELADCFSSKAEGVRHIVTTLQAASAGRHLRIYLVDGRLVAPQVALQHARLAAASNWHALARFACRFVSAGTSLLIDVGSTTTDLVRLTSTGITTESVTDTERLLAGELVYSGVSRSPLCGIARQVPYRGRFCSVANELFATTRDVYLILGKLAESPLDCETADGRPASKVHSRARLGRMICADEEDFHHRDAVVMANSFAGQQAKRLSRAILSLSADGTPAEVVLSGQGDFLAEHALRLCGWKGEMHSFRERFGVSVSSCAPAHALAVIARESRQPQ